MRLANVDGRAVLLTADGGFRAWADHAHAAESGFASPDRLPPTFTEFRSALTGPDAEVVITPVAGVTIGQDISERV